jgi:hypothetical protein
VQADLPTSPPENMSAPRGGTGYSVFISSFSIMSLVCEANGWPHLQELSVSFITVTETDYNVVQREAGTTPMALAQESGCRRARSEDFSYEVEESKRLVISFPATDANFYASSPRTPISPKIESVCAP